PQDQAARDAAIKGVTIVSDKTSGTGTSLPEGMPRRVTVLSDDQKDRWRWRVDPTPEGLTVTFANPAVPTGDYTLTVQGEGTDGLPVTLRNVTRGRWNRVDADDDGDFTLTLKARPGDRLELLRNRKSIAYVATLGVGVEVVDVNAFYNEAPEEPTNTPESDVLGIYTGYGDPTLSLCGAPVSDIASTLDLGTLFDASPGYPHPITVVALIGFRGLALLHSPIDNVGSLRFFNESCLNVDGSAQVSGLDVVEDYPIDFDEDGELEESEERDYVLVSHRGKGLFIFDATDREELVPVGRVTLPGQAAHVGFDRERRKIYVSAHGAGIFVVDFDELPGRESMIDINGDGTDDRVLETIPLPNANNNSPVFLVPELGVAYAGGLNRGLTSIEVGTPLLATVAEEREQVVPAPDPAAIERPRLRPVGRLAPLGVPTAPESFGGGGPELSASFRVLATLPAVVGAETKVDVVSLGPGGLPISGAGDADVIADLPRPALEGENGVVLRRLADQPWEDGYQLYLSKEIAVLADLRAAKAYQRTAKEDEQCVRCDQEELHIQIDALEILSGTKIAVRLPAELRQKLGKMYDDARLDASEITVESVPWEVAPAVRQEPQLNPSMGMGDVAPGTLLHSGEMTHTASDLFIKGRKLDFAFKRVYRNQTVGSGPLGPGWDHVYNMRLRRLPNRDVEYYDGRGRRVLFKRQENGTLEAPTGMFVTLERTSAGWVMLDAGRNLYRFDGFGRLTAIADAFKDSTENGNEITFFYNLDSRLTRIVANHREVLLSYDSEGRLEEVRDFSGREVEYAYDDAGRLERVTSPAITTGESQFPDGLTTAYSYETGAGALAAHLALRDNLKAVTDPKGQTWLELEFGDQDGDGRSEEVVLQRWGEDFVSLSYDLGPAGNTTATVTDRRGHDAVYAHNVAGQVRSVQDRGGFTSTFEYDDEGIRTREVTPLGRRIESQPDATPALRRARGNISRMTIVADSRGPNGSSSELVKLNQQFDESTNLPTVETDARGARKETDRNRDGLPERVTVQGDGETPTAVTIY
ncbi:MAG TPA: DUF6531 domain-containing protein, partial [Actinomycetota bacterium]|nr:DUF6531 domain-containing protein [Actinomycetota bacterium]